GQRFGVEYLVDVLLGNANERILRLGHDRLKTFGVGSELDQRQWRSAFRQLVAQGHLDVDIEGHGGLRLGGSAQGVLRGETPVTFRGEPKHAARTPRKRQAGAPVEALSGADETLWQALRARRLTLAKEQGVPPYIIFHDATLLEMVRRRPRDRAALGEIPGVGRSKLERYGDIFLGVIAGAAHESS
ncbi:MAG: RQC domain-containing protein, partial [Alphaproteobacteria bacterium]